MSVTHNLFVLRHKETQQYVGYDFDFIKFSLEENIYRAYFFSDVDDELLDLVLFTEYWDYDVEFRTLEFELVEVSLSIGSTVLLLKGDEKQLIGR
jgi:hypothetical protein